MLRVENSNNTSEYLRVEQAEQHDFSVFKRAGLDPGLLLTRGE